ncbi:DUF6559 family protein [Microbulbifer thermotolerans]|uniref:DUF6559 family protein n=1 Tax=Microbulbifer thermotolerans TaxID=252514 RepID=UPI002248F963|nr:DUF6559 family protein [Microbulbifer thermotolerans]MCX2781160.1 hypothetical protein [Microbulbifer thermotolerans]MCX2796316.1 hypothetical protein [Microbulbifer thermotolerans]MCX2806577.1 hypothetical protein [Microbulbifer thermotolerans]MCX2832980.1 hypothetical protein [Microbulbifer thermotolerans]
MAFFTGFILRIKKNRAIKLYLRKLPRLLQKDYGRSKRYRPKQVRATIERSGLPVEFSCYAILIFCSKKAFDRYHTEMGETCDYEAMRSYVGNLFFNGNTNFSAHEVLPSSTDFDGGFHGIDTGGSD